MSEGPSTHFQQRRLKFPSGNDMITFLERSFALLLGLSSSTHAVQAAQAPATFWILVFFLWPPACVIICLESCSVTHPISPLRSTTTNLCSLILLHLLVPLPPLDYKLFEEGEARTVLLTVHRLCLQVVYLQHQC